MRLSRRSLISALTVLIVLVCLACGETNPVQPTPPIINDTFNGTLAPGGRATHAFTIQTAGGLDVTVISLSPDPTITIGVGLGKPAGDGVCTLTLENKAAHQASLISASVTVAGTYCFAIYDVGGIAADTTTDYIVTLTHF